MSGLDPNPLVTARNFHAGSFLVGLAVGRIWSEYNKACNLDKRKANLSLGDYLWRLSIGWREVRSDEEAVSVASKTRFKLIDLKTTKLTLDVPKMERKYDALLPVIQRI